MIPQRNVVLVVVLFTGCGSGLGDFRTLNVWEAVVYRLTLRCVTMRFLRYVMHYNLILATQAPLASAVQYTSSSCQAAALALSSMHARETHHPLQFRWCWQKCR